MSFARYSSCLWLAPGHRWQYSTGTNNRSTQTFIHFTNCGGSRSTLTKLSSRTLYSTLQQPHRYRDLSGSSWQAKQNCSLIIRRETQINLTSYKSSVIKIGIQTIRPKPCEFGQVDKTAVDCRRLLVKLTGSIIRSRVLKACENPRSRSSK